MSANFTMMVEVDGRLVSAWKMPIAAVNHDWASKVLHEQMVPFFIGRMNEAHGHPASPPPPPE